MNNEGIKDFRSDTQSKVPEGMLEAMKAAELGDDIFHDDPTVNKLEEKMAKLFGKEAAMWTPTATMSNLTGVLASTRPSNEVVAASNSHFIQREGGGMAVIAGLQTAQIESETGLLSVADVQQAFRRTKMDEMYPDTQLVFLQNPTFHGDVHSLQELKRISEFAHDNGAKVHIDGARIFNAIVHYGCEPSDLAAFFDSMTICLSKGLCCPTGAVLIGSGDFIKRARFYRSMLGGNMRQVGVLAGAALYALQHVYPAVTARDNELAKYLGTELDKLPLMSVPVAKISCNLLRLYPQQPLLSRIPEYLNFLLQKGIKVKAINTEHSFIRLSIYKEITKNDCDQLITETKKFIELISEKQQ